MSKLVEVRFINGHGWRYWTTGQVARIPSHIAREFHRDGKIEYVVEAEDPKEQKLEQVLAEAAPPKNPVSKDMQTPVDRAIHQSPVTPTIRAQDYSVKQLTDVVEHMNSIDEVEQFFTSEMTNTEYPGGRSTAIKLIRKRLEELKGS